MRHADSTFDPGATLSRLVRDLEEIYVVDPPADLCASIDRLARQHQPMPAGRQRSARWFHQPYRLSPVMVVLLICLAVASGVVAVGPFSNRAFELDAGTARVMSAGLGTVVNQTQSIEGYNITIESVYADGNRLIIGYRIDIGAHEQAIDAWLDQPTATTANGQTLMRHGSLGAHVIDGSADSFVWFDTSSLADVGERLHVRLDVSALLVAEFDAGVLGAIVPHSLLTHIADGETLREIPLSTHFDLDVPVQRTRTMSIGVPAMANDHSVTLERISVAPSSTIVWLSGLEEVGRMTLVVPETEPANVRVSNVWQTADGLLAVEFNDPQLERPGIWTLIVEPLKVSSAGGQFIVDQGDMPWVWTFEIE
jgi:hypothetical protein